MSGRRAGFQPPGSLDRYLRPIATVRPFDTVDDVRQHLNRLGPGGRHVDRVALIGPDGDLLADISLFSLVTAAPANPVGPLAFDAGRDHVRLDQSIDDTIQVLLSSQRRSLVVVDDADRPVGRVHAADLIDHLRQRKRPRRPA